MKAFNFMLENSYANGAKLTKMKEKNEFLN